MRAERLAAPRADARSRGTILAMGPDILIVLIIVLVAVLLWRGPKNLPKLGEALGRGVREAKSEATQV